MRANPAPSSARARQKASQSTRSSSSTSQPYSGRVNDRLMILRAGRSFLLVEGIARRPRRQPHRDGAEAQLAADAVDEVAQVAVRQLVDAGPEQDEGGRAGVDLGDVAKLDSAAAGGGRRVLLDRFLEPAVEPAGRD